MTKRILSILLAMLLALGAFSMTALADEAPVELTIASSVKRQLTAHGATKSVRWLKFAAISIFRAQCGWKSIAVNTPIFAAQHSCRSILSRKCPSTSSKLNFSTIPVKSAAAKTRAISSTAFEVRYGKSKNNVRMQSVRL